MFAPTDDLALSARANEQDRSYSDSFKPRHASGKQADTRKAKSAQTTPGLDSADEIQVIEEQQVAIPIRAGLDRRHSDRHLDLDVGSIHAGKRKPSPLFERRKMDDLDLLDGFSESSDDEADNRHTTRSQIVRGREPHSKPLLHPKQTSFLQAARHYDYGSSRQAPCSPQLGRHSSRDCSPHGRLPPMERDAEAKGRHSSYAKKSGYMHGPYTARVTPPPPGLNGLEHEAMVFDNFEDVPSVSSIAEQEQDNKEPFDAHLHFVRPAMPICANPGAFVALEPILTPAGSPPNDYLQDGGKAREAEAQRKRHRFGHHRAVSELFTMIPTTSVKAADVRATRRRATVGSEAAYRLRTLHHRQSDLST
ncbi:hypothetical protein EX895_003431 [Sporisorium graminicola]|uniref:Uncharacterized protein n=1 Tax=Sporisorium graminicola TaxID=280036 RepID=A0A4U7KTM7_9BASI|nr:hypothetical protein EX895_003431 [Sporisorium graminicola]TKY87850.1 hypothetical protein EX895_003431 [Sporisorium graminicola]